MIQNLTSLRFVFMMMIFRSHYVHDGFGVFDFGGEVGVAFFFMLSGFVLSMRYGEDMRSGQFCHGAFLKRQLTKFYPLHLLCLLVIVTTGIRYINGAYLVKMLPSVLLLQSWIPNVDWYFFGNAVSWYLSTLLAIYVAFPLIWRTVNLRWAVLARVAALLAVVYGAYLAIVPAESYNGTVYAQPIVRCYDFAIGCLSYRLLPIANRLISTKRRAIVAECVVVAIMSLTYWLYPLIDNRVHCASLFWPVGMTCLLVFASADRVGASSRRYCTADGWNFWEE